VLGLGILVFALTLLAAAGRFVRRRFGQPRPGDQLPGRWLVVTLAALNIVFAVAVVALASDDSALLSGTPKGLIAALALPVLGALLALGAAAMAVRQWRRREGTTGARVRYDAIVVLALLFLWSLNTWNLLGWRM
jgi:hypothetical protein